MGTILHLLKNIQLSFYCVQVSTSSALLYWIKKVRYEILAAMCNTVCVCVWVLAHAYANPPFPNRVRRSDTIKLLQPLFVLENKSTSRLLMLSLSSGPVIVLNVLHLKRKGLEVFPQARSVSWPLKFWPSKEKKPFKLKLRCRSDSFGSNNNKLYSSLEFVSHIQSQLFSVSE